jgi:SpoVK/Ycf46/Vps4 family AAA+-type ATPase
LANDVGEARRILNSFLQMVEETQSNSLILAATNHPGILDTALYRRFDDVLIYELPDQAHIESILKERLCAHVPEDFHWEELVCGAEGLSYAEITQAANEVIKTAIITHTEILIEELVKDALLERKEMRKQLKL